MLLRIRSLRTRQALLPFGARAERRDRQFKGVIAATTGFALLCLMCGSPTLLRGAGALTRRLKWGAERWIGLEPSRAEIEAASSTRRAAGIAQTKATYRRVFAQLDPSFQALVRAAGMAPDDAVIRWGNYDRTLVLSSKVFEPDDNGRSYHLRPNTRAFWLLRRVSLAEGLHGLFLIPDSPDLLQAVKDTQTLVLPGSTQTTNSWGCRGPEPDPSAPYRGLILGDSYMQGFLIGDDQTPPACLEKYLHEQWKVPVSILNTGHLGYSPEQYYYTLLAYGERFRPQFVVVSICANDFGDLYAAFRGEGDWEEGAYWLRQIQLYCNARGILCVLTPIPDQIQIISRRDSGYFQGQVSKIFPYSSLHFVDPIDDFVNEHLRLMREASMRGQRPYHSPLYNGQYADGHFSALGSQVWARAIGRRLALLVNGPSPIQSQSARLKEYEARSGNL
jgi:hypothetical protein